jgi:hypothetical protein
MIHGVHADRTEGGGALVSLPQAELIVLFELLHRWELDGTVRRLHFEDQAEQRLIWDLTATLEDVVDEVFSDEYAVLLDGARAAVRDPAD